MGGMITNWWHDYQLPAKRWLSQCRDIMESWCYDVLIELMETLS